MDTKKKTRNIIILASCIVLVAIVVAVVAIFGKKDTDLETLAEEVTIGTSATTVATTTVATTTTTVTTTTQATTTEATTVTTTEATTTEATTTETTQEVFSYTPTIKKSTVESMHNSNPNCKGWIYIKNTVIDYPIMQSDDNVFYVHHNYNDAESNSGSIMLDYECTIGKTTNTLLYGHNMGNGSMFHQIKSYKDSSWWLNHQYVEVANLEKIYIYQIFSVDVLYGTSDASFKYWVEPNKSLADEDTYNTFVNTVVAKRYTSAGISAPSYPTGILTLQTCNSGADDGIRCVAFGKLVAICDLQ